MAFMFENPGIPSGELYVNIGTEKSCCFVRMSVRFCKKLEEYPLLYYAVEESLECSKLGYFSAGIIVLSQVLHILEGHKNVPEARNKVAHESLKWRPSKKDFDDVLRQVKRAAEDIYERERSRADDPKVYYERVQAMWESAISSLNRSQSSTQDGLECT